MKMSGVSLMPAAIPTPMPRNRPVAPTRSTITSSSRIRLIWPIHRLNVIGASGSMTRLATAVHRMRAAGSVIPSGPSSDQITASMASTEISVQTVTATGAGRRASGPNTTAAIGG
jgi:hypothetical protein